MTFDKTAYQREYMRKRRASDNVSEECTKCEIFRKYCPGYKDYLQLCPQIDIRDRAMYKEAKVSKKLLKIIGTPKSTPIKYVPISSNTHYHLTQRIRSPDESISDVIDRLIQIEDEYENIDDRIKKLAERYEKIIQDLKAELNNKN